MSLLALEHVEKAYGSGSGRHVVLRDVSLEIEAGEMVAVWGLRRSGRSTLLRVAAGIEAPDAGSVRFEGHDLRGRSRGREALGEQIGYCRKTFRPSEGRLVIDHLIVGQLARGERPRTRRPARAWRFSSSRCSQRPGSTCPRRTSSAQRTRAPPPSCSASSPAGRAASWSSTPATTPSSPSPPPSAT